MDLFDILVIGGGPVGSRVAYRLAEMGHDVLVAEQKADLAGPVCCTGIISQACVNQFDIDRSIVLKEANSARVFSPSGKILELKRTEPQACIVDRPAFNIALSEKAQTAGVRYLLDSPVGNLAVERNRVRIGLRGRENSDFLEARAVVIAAGSASKLVESLGFGRADDFAMGIQATVATRVVEEVEVYLGQSVAPGFFAWMVPLAQGRALVGLLARRKAGYYLKRFVSYLAERGKVISLETEPSYAVVPLKPLPRTYSDRLLVVGSAAGQVKPTTGGGIYYGLLSADIAADSLHQALDNNDLSAKSLSLYEKGWKRKLGRDIAIGYWARRFYERLSDRRIDDIIDIIKSNGIDRALLEADDVSFDRHGSAILKVVGHRALTGVIEAFKFPFPSGKRITKES